MIALLLFVVFLSIAHAESKFSPGLPDVCKIKSASMPHQKAKDALADAKDKADCSSEDKER